MAYEILVRESHVDSLGHMNNATYLALYEEARWQQITEQGYGFQQIQELKQGPVILDVFVKFQKEIRLRETIRIQTELIKYEGKVGQLKQQMLKEDGTVASEAVFTFGLFDMKLRKLIEPTAMWLQALSVKK